MSTASSNSNAEVEAAVVSLCDRLCLNNDLYQAFLADPSSIVAKYVSQARIQKAVRLKVGERLNKARLESHWENSIACACRDVAYQLPE